MVNKVRVFLLGEAGIGKTKLIDALKEELFPPLYYQPTPGIERSIIYHNDMQILIYDAGRRYQFSLLSHGYYKDVDTIVLAFSFNHLLSLKALEKTHQYAKEKNPRAHFILLGLPPLSSEGEELLNDQDVTHFLRKTGVTHYLCCDGNNPKQLELFKSQLTYRLNLEEGSQMPPRFKECYEKFWIEQHSLLSNIKAVFFNYLRFSKARFTPNLFLDSSNSGALVKRALKQYGHSNSLTEAKQLLLALEQVIPKDNHSLHRRLQFVEDKVKIIESQRLLSTEQESRSLTV